MFYSYLYLQFFILHEVVFGEKNEEVASSYRNVSFTYSGGDCDTNVASKAAVAFLGTAIDAAHTNVLALQSSAAGSATNVGVQILDRTGVALTLDGATFSSETTLNNGTNTIPFQARYFATGAATPGAANADATFKVQYQ
jgi:major type 1 subunit fimbrin (pilin)